MKKKTLSILLFCNPLLLTHPKRPSPLIELNSLPANTSPTSSKDSSPVSSIKSTQQAGQSRTPKQENYQTSNNSSNVMRFLEEKQIKEEQLQCKATTCAVFGALSTIALAIALNACNQTHIQ